MACKQNGADNSVVVREHYLRKDVPCHSEICPGCEQGRGSNETLYHDYFSQSEGSVGENLQIIFCLLEFSYSPVVQKNASLFCRFLPEHIMHNAPDKCLASG